MLGDVALLAKYLADIALLAVFCPTYESTVSRTDYICLLLGLRIVKFAFSIVYNTYIVYIIYCKNETEKGPSVSVVGSEDCFVSAESPSE